MKINHQSANQVSNKVETNKVETKPVTNKKSEIKDDKSVKTDLPVIPLKDELSVNSKTSSSKSGIISFVDDESPLNIFDQTFNDLKLSKTFFTPELSYKDNSRKYSTSYIKPEIKPESAITSNYDEKNKITTIESKGNVNSTKTQFDEKTKLISTEVINGDSKRNIKFKGGFDGNTSEIKPLGVEANYENANFKTLYDPKAENFKTEMMAGNDSTNVKIKSDYDIKTSNVKGMSIENTINKDTAIKASYGADKLVSTEISQNIESTNVKLNSSYDSSNSNFKNIGLETSLNGNSLKTGYNVGEKALVTEIGTSLAGSKLKAVGGYNLQENIISKAGLEYDYQGINISTSYINNQNPIIADTSSIAGRNVNVMVKNSFGEVSTDLSADNFGVNRVKFAKPISFGDNMPEIKVNAEYNSDKYLINNNASGRFGVGIEANVFEKASLTYSSKFGNTNTQSVGIKYHLLKNTDFSMEANVNPSDKTAPAFRATFSTGFKF